MRRLLAIAAIFCVGSSLPTLKYRALDDDGNPISGALLYFYEDGTTTPLATYSDEALSSANANPVVADSNGWFGEIYLKTDEAYKVVLKNSDASTTYWTIDDINATQLTSSSITTRLKQVASNPLDYGAVGDGVADESSYVQSAIDAATGTVDLLGKTYRCDSGITLSSGITLKNGTLDFTNSMDTVLIDASGTIADSSTNLITDADSGDEYISVNSVAGLSDFDWIEISSTGAYVPSGGATKEIAQIQDIDGGTLRLYLTSPVMHNYATADSALFKKITEVSDVKLDGVSITLGAGSSVDAVIMLGYTHNARINDVSIQGGQSATALLAMYSSAGVVISGYNNILSSQSAPTTNGIVVSGASRDISILNSRLSNTGVTITGSPAHGIVIEGNEFDGGGVSLPNGFQLTPSLYAYPYSEDVIVSSNIFRSRDESFVMGTLSASINTRIIGNTIIGGEGIRLLLEPGEDGVFEISRNEIIVSATGTIDIDDGASASGDVTSIIISDNRMNLYGGVDIDIDDNGANSVSVEEILISGNSIESLVAPVVVDQHNNATLDRLLVVGNTMIGPANFSVVELDTDTGMEVVVSGNYSESGDDAQPNINIDLGASGGPVTVTGNCITNGATGVSLTNTSDTMISGNSFSSVTAEISTHAVAVGVVTIAAANTACNTTCGDFTCFSGYDDGVPAVVVCTDATADRCLCFP